MFINRYLAAFARGHGGKITVTCFLQLILTLLGTMISLGVAFVVRMLQGEARILFFLEARIFLSELGSGLRIFEQRLRRGVAREKIAHIGSALRNTLGNIGIVPEICCSDLGLEFFKFAFTFVDMEKTARITKALARCIKRDHRWKTSCIQSRVIPP